MVVIKEGRGIFPSGGSKLLHVSFVLVTALRSNTSLHEQPHFQDVTFVTNILLSSVELVFFPTRNS